MLTILLTTLILMLVITLSTYATDDDWTFALINGIIGGGLMGLLLGFLLSIMITSDTYVRETVYNIECLSDKSSVDGTFFLGSGNINGTMSYSYYYKTSDSAFRMNVINYTQGEIKYTTGRPKVHIYDKVRVPDSLSPHNKNWSNMPAMSSSWYVFEVPVSSVENNYKLDAK